MSKKLIPYYAVIFTSKLSNNNNNNGYEDMADKMVELAKTQKGFLGIDSARNDVGITVSYWESLEDIKSWKAHSEHLLAQEKGQETWYDWYDVKICRVEREYQFGKK